MRVALRADASGRMGTGHFRRCQSLAAALRARGAETLLIARRHDEVSERTAGNERVAWLPPGRPDFQPAAGDPPHAAWAAAAWDEDAAQTEHALAGFAPDWIVVDHYALDARWHEHLVRATGARIAAIDDLGDRTLRAELVVDHNLQPTSRDKYAGRLVKPSRLLLGPRYALLASRYAVAPRYHFRRQVGSIGIFISGGGGADLAMQALVACRDVAGFQGLIEIVGPASGSERDRLEAAARAQPPAQVLSDLPDLCEFYARHDLQIGSGGGAAWERCCLGAPTLAVQIAQNQQAVLPLLAQHGAVAWVDPPSGLAIGDAVARLVKEPRARLALARAGRALVDGKGSSRVAAVMQMSVSPRLMLRPAEHADEALLLAWANDPETRRQAFQTRTIAASAHAAWFRARLADPSSCCVLVATTPEGVPIGQVRFDRRDDAWEVDYSLDPAFRGLGLARTVLAQALVALASEDRQPTRVRGLVKVSNPASVRVFRSLGFQETMSTRESGICHAMTLELTPRR